MFEVAYRASAARTVAPHASGPLDWPTVWHALAEALRAHHQVGRRHLLTEDVVRFATITVLAEHGVDASRLAAEVNIAGVGFIDLFVDRPDGVAIEFKFPREPSEKNAADTMAFGELLRDFYRLARLDVTEAWAVQLIRPKFAQYLTKRSELAWTATAGAILELPAGLRELLPASAKEKVPAWATDTVTATCVLAERVGDDVLAAYKVD